MKKQFDIPYSQDLQETRLLDLFLPEDSNGCAILWVHGGGWQGGSRQSWHGPAEHFAGLGYVCASCSYRLVPDNQWPAPIEDVRLAMRWFRCRAAEYGFSANRMAAAGSSAGGHLVAMLATIDAPDTLGATPELDQSDTRPNAAVCYCPVTTLRGAGIESLTETVQGLMGGCEEEMSKAYTLASPLDRTTGRASPILFLHGDADNTVSLQQSQDMYAKLIDAGVPAELVILPGVGHGFGYGVTTDEQKRSLQEIERFLSLRFLRRE